ncbi:hypothetical protein L210DRAFT_3533761 [Boletus edulis BED1]|uniref:Uncharacterized protein n=1 Tax=Boletus edulis BED1 TaxID=1328754 RepID=A0AAD4C0I8_BOLED|nr:hypothetical protein L210DRAFT_3533761 [Boletus edulis BED1]
MRSNVADIAFVNHRLSLSLSGPSVELQTIATNASEPLTKSALELGKYKITVNVYAPGIVNTPMVEALVDIAEADMEMYNVAISRLSTRAIEAESQPEEITSIVSYLASKEAHFITAVLS